MQLLSKVKSLFAKRDKRQEKELQEDFLKAIYEQGGSMSTDEAKRSAEALHTNNEGISAIVGALALQGEIAIGEQLKLTEKGRTHALKLIRAHRIYEQYLAEHSGVPVWNGLTTEFHPTQVLADFLTILEKKGTLKGIKFAYLGDGKNNMASSLMIGAAKFGMDFTIVAPKEYLPDKELAETALKLAEENGGRVSFTDDRIGGVKDADVIYTDVWVSMGESYDVWEERINRLSYYQVNSELVKHAKDDYLFMHCLPAFHDLNTKVAKEIEKKYGIKEMEVTDEVFRSKNSVVFDEAENRMHTIKAVMVATLGDISIFKF